MCVLGQADDVFIGDARGVVVGGDEIAKVLQERASVSNDVGGPL